MASSLSKPCPWCNRSELVSMNCTSHFDLINFDDEHAELRNEIGPLITGEDPSDESASFEANCQSSITSCNSTKAAVHATEELANIAIPCSATPMFDYETTPNPQDNEDQFLRDTKEAIRRSLQDQRFIQLECGKYDDGTGGEVTLNSPAPKVKCMLSEDEEDEQTLHQKSISKTIAWDDGERRRREQGIGKELTLLTKEGEEDNKHHQPGGSAATQAREDPLVHMIPLKDKRAREAAYATSFFAVPDNDAGSRRKLNTSTKTQPIEPVRRLYNENNRTVRTIATPRRRRK